MADIERKFLAHFLNVSSTSTLSYHRLGKDLEEMNVELNAEVNKKRNILGEESVKVTGYEAQSSVEPYYANPGDGLYEFLQDIIDNRKVLDDVKTDAVEVHLWDETTANSGVYVAYKESVMVEPTSYGGDNTGYQIPFNIHYLGDRVKGTFTLSTKTFAADNINV